MTGRKIAILGGSSAFLPALADAIAARAGELPPLDITLYGRSAERTECVARFCSRVAQRREVDHDYAPSVDLAEAVRGADVVVNQMRVGGWPGRTHDERFPLAHGLPGDETIGPGGLASALRSAPAVLEAARVAAAEAPGAPFLQLSNPMGILLAMLRNAGLPAIGLCELPGETLRLALRTIGLTPDEVEAQYLGVNHQGWFVSVRHGEREVLPDILRAIAALGGASSFRVDGELLVREGVLPLPYMRLYYHREREVAALRASARARGEELAELAAALHAHYAHDDSGVHPEILASRSMPWLPDAFAPALVALLGGPAQRLYVSAPNGGHVPGLPEEAIVEKYAQVSRTGIEPRELRLPAGSRTAGFVHFLGRIVDYEEAAARCLIERAAGSNGSGTPPALVEALLRHPFEIDPETAQALATEAMPPVPALEDARR